MEISLVQKIHHEYHPCVTSRLSPEKRRIARHALEESVRIDDGGTMRSGRTVDVSRNGMRILVDNPEGFDNESRVYVSLPGTAGDGVPCLVKRSENDRGVWDIGLEFDGENEARMLLVERWLESLERRRQETDSAPTESRQVPRTRCNIEEIHSENAHVRVVSAEDISTDGILLRVQGKIHRGDPLSIVARLTKTDREIPILGEVAYVGDEGSDYSKYVGLSFREIRETDRNRIRNYIVEIASGAALLEYHHLLESEKPEAEYQVSGSDIQDIVDRLIEAGSTVNLLDDIGLKIIETRIESIIDGYFFAPTPPTFSPGGKAFFSFTRETASYYFSTDKKTDAEGMVHFRVPSAIYRGEKRMGRRQQAHGRVDVTFRRSDGSETRKGHIVDSSRRGILCEFEKRVFNIEPESGQACDIRIDGHTVPGEVRHVVYRLEEGHKPVLRIGFETGIVRKDPRLRRYAQETWKSDWNGPEYALNDPKTVLPKPVEYRDESGRKIAGLLHITDPDVTCTTVLIAPAFGKKKEAMAPLALSIVANFKAAGENVAVLRYDGIDRPGESENSIRHARRGYEMIGYRIDQGYLDLEASMRWIRNNDIYRSGKVVLISSSMAALDARRLQSSKNAPSADFWISLMGVSSAQSALRNILGGLDVVANHRMGLPIGTMGMLGQLIDMDRMAADMTRLGYATATDARESMGQISSPVSWFYGLYDKWVSVDEIRDVMSIASPGDREIIEVPTAHNLRTSDDALTTFAIISKTILGRVTDKDVPVVMPRKSEMLDLLSRERERIIENEELDAKRYWKGYLVGESDSDEGYDFYRRLGEFQEFMNDEADILDPRPGENIADMGSGTGLVSEAILKKLARYEDLSETTFTAVDLVDIALEKAAAKYEKLCSCHSSLADIDDTWLTMDLEPDPLSALRRFIAGDIACFEDLKNKVKGLKVETIDRLSRTMDPILIKAIKGQRIDSGSWSRITAEHSPDISVIRDLHRASRFILGDLDEDDLKLTRRRGKGTISSERLSRMRTSDLDLRTLDLGDWDRSGRLPLPDSQFDKICASLFLSYLFAPGEAVKEFARQLRPGGSLLISSMKPDSDISGIFTRYIEEQENLDAETARTEEREHNLREARSMLNEAAALFSLEEDGWFRFFSERDLIVMLREAGLTDIRTYESLGKPAQAVIAIGTKKSD